jgi:hypothetical protein
MVFDHAMKCQSKISIAESLSEFFRGLKQQARSNSRILSIPIRHKEEEGEHKGIRDMEDFSAGSDHVLRRWRSLARYSKGALLQPQSSRLPDLGHDRIEHERDHSRGYRGYARNALWTSPSTTGSRRDGIPKQPRSDGTRSSKWRRFHNKSGTGKRIKWQEIAMSSRDTASSNATGPTTK